MRKSAGLKIILVLALVQAGLALLRAYNWVQIGADLFGEGVLLLPLVGAMALMRGLFVFALALLYALFVVAALLEKSWSWWFCFAAVIINLLLVVSAVAQGGASLIEAIVWSAIPVILIIYFFLQKESHALTHA